MARWIGGSLVVVLVLLGGAWMFREALLLGFVRFQAEQRMPVDPHREVVWSGAARDAPAG